MMTLWIVELNRHPWEDLREIAGSAGNVRGSLRRMLTAATPTDAEKAYWELENHVVVQGQLFESAERVVPVLLAALLDESPPHVRISILELLFQIVSGEAHPEEENQQIGDKCRQRAREGLWLLYRELSCSLKGQREAAVEVLEVLETDMHRVADFLEAIGD